MATFLMIHGAWHGGWCFDRLRAPLEAAGHQLVAPDLPGAGGNARALATASLDRWTKFVAEEARKLPGPVILCGHSRGGVVISQVAEEAPDAIAALVYIAGALVPHGSSLYDVIGASMDQGEFGEALTAVADGLGVQFSPQAAKAFFYNRCTPEDQDACASRLIVEPVRPLGTAVCLSDARYGRVPRHYIECVHDRTFPRAAQVAMQDAQPCASVTTLESDHSPFICMPDQLAAALIGITERMEI